MASSSQTVTVITRGYVCFLLLIHLINYDHVDYMYQNDHNNLVS